MIELIYIMDPHCGWCFGFGKVIAELYETYKNNPSVRFDVKPGGLFFPAIKTHKNFADDKRPIAKRVEALSGVTFSQTYFTQILGGSVLNSEPPARAILTIKQMHPELLIPFTEKLLELEFVAAKNTSLETVIFEAVEAVNVNLESFKTLFHSQKIKQGVLTEFNEVRSLTTGYPALFLKKDGQLSKLAGGYAPLERLVKKIEAVLG